MQCERAIFLPANPGNPQSSSRASGEKIKLSIKLKMREREIGQMISGDVRNALWLSRFTIQNLTKFQNFITIYINIIERSQ